MLSCGGRLSPDAFGPNDAPCGQAGPVKYGSGGKPQGYAIKTSDGTCPLDAQRTYPVLETGHKIVVDWHPNFDEKFTCAVGPPDRISCIDADQHGFVIEPSGAWTF